VSNDLCGTELARAFHAEVVGPLLTRERPGLCYAAARLGSGSDVLGLDDATSRDHDWGCRLTVLVRSDDAAAVAGIQRLLEDQLPDDFRGWPVRFPVTWNPHDVHQVEVATVEGFAASRLGAAPPLSHLDWLIVTGQGALEVTAGPVFIDTTETLAPLRESLRWYPDEVDRVVLAAGWGRAGRMPLHGRTAQRGQELQSRLLAAEAVDALMRLAFLVHRRWMPYAKWREALFRTLPTADALTPHFEAALAGATWQEREDALAAACDVLLEAQRDSGRPTPSRATAMFWDRPYRVVAPDIFELLRAGVTDPDLQRLPRDVGSVEQWIDLDEVLAKPELRATALATYRAWLTRLGES
jgi:hypothetical protein